MLVAQKAEPVVERLVCKTFGIEDEGFDLTLFMDPRINLRP